MAVTRSTRAERTELRRVPGGRAAWRVRELIWTVGAAVLIAAGLSLVYRAKTQDFAEIEQGLASKKLLNLNALGAREELLPALSVVPGQRAREEAARRI